jgi:hypothetical protein
MSVMCTQLCGCEGEKLGYKHMVTFEVMFGTKLHVGHFRTRNRPGRAPRVGESQPNCLHGGFEIFRNQSFKMSKNQGYLNFLGVMV